MAEALEINNLPTPKQEEWKYTNLGRALPKNLADGVAESQVFHLKKNEIRKEAAEISFSGSDSTHTQPKLEVTLEEGAQFTLIERHDGEGAYWKNMVSLINLAPNSHFVHIRLIEDSNEAVNTNMVRVELERDSNYEVLTLHTGGKLSRHQIHAFLNGPNAECSFNGLSLQDKKQHSDSTILIEHAAPHCRSNQFYRYVLDDQARGVFQGKVHVHQAAQKTDGYQMCKALLLSEGTEMDTKPELEIYADDVLCSHGATTGQIQDDALFYMMSRGISEKEARALLIKAFAAEVLDRLSVNILYDELLDRVEKWLKR